MFGLGCCCARNKSSGASVGPVVNKRWLGRSVTLPAKAVYRIDSMSIAHRFTAAALHIHRRILAFPPSALFIRMPSPGDEYPQYRQTPHCDPRFSLSDQPDVVLWTELEPQNPCLASWNLTFCVQVPEPSGRICTIHYVLFYADRVVYFISIFQGG